MATPDNTALNTGSGGSLIDTVDVATSPTIQRQVAAIGDGTARGNLAAVDGAGTLRTRISNTTQQTAESSTNQAAGATVQGAAFDTGDNSTGAGPGFSKFRGALFADQVGTLKIQTSRNGTTWRDQLSTATQANVVTVLEAWTSRRYMRVTWTNNGASTTTVMELDSEALAT